MNDDRRWMAHALVLAQRGLYTTHPNPRVGCVLVNAGVMVGQGWHERAGEAHAEVMALRDAGPRAQGAVAYVTLEPCSHTGRTPPCADALLAAGVQRVVAAMQDPNPQVAGQGLARLRAAGLEVECGLMEAEAEALNAGFLRRMRGGLPWVRIKLAASLDGRTAMADGSARWITGEAARRDVQRWRARSDVVLTGVGTVLCDNPALNLREELWPVGEFPQRQPWRVVLDSHLRTPLTAQILRLPGRCTLVGVEGHHQRQDGTECRQLEGDRPSPEAVLRMLAQEGVNEVLIEAGAGIAGSFMRSGCVDELILYLAPTLLGSQARPLMDLPIVTMADQLRLRLKDQRAVGDDWRLVLERT